MADDKPQGVIAIASEPAAGAEPAHVSVYIDGDRRFTIRTNDLESIGAQLRGKKEFSFFNSIGLPIMISLLTVVGTTVIGQFFQYVSWHNSTALQAATLAAQRALSTYQKASVAIDKRYHETNLFLAATHDLANKKSDSDNTIHKLAVDLNQQRFNAFYAQLKSWHEDYDGTLAAIDYTLDHPVNLHEHFSVRYFNGANNAPKLDCSQLLVGEFRRLKLEINSLKLQFAALNYCFTQSISGFDDGEYDAVVDNAGIISDDVKKKTGDLNDDVHSMSNEFRCFAQHRIEFLEQRKQSAIFNLSTWIYDKSIGHATEWLATMPDPIAAHFASTLKDCDMSPPPSQG